MKRHLILSSLVGVMVVSLFGEAFALDGWRDRRGMYMGLLVGGGSAKADLDGAKSELGYNFGAGLAAVYPKHSLDAA